MRILNNLIMSKNVEGTLWGFFNIHPVAKYQKKLKGTLWRDLRHDTVHTVVVVVNQLIYLSVYPGHVLGTHATDEFAQSLELPLLHARGVKVEPASNVLEQHFSLPALPVPLAQKVVHLSANNTARCQILVSQNP